MVAAWGVLLPAGAFAARFGKIPDLSVWPRELEDLRWWNGHRVLQWSGIAVMGVGLWLVWGAAMGADRLALVHGWMGWTVCAMGLFQVGFALIRGTKGGPTETSMRGDHYDMTPWRNWFERVHKSVGWMALLLAIVTIALGLVLSDAPRWMAVVLSAWWLLLIVAFAWLQSRGRCIDTYQAIWGPDPVHPGNRVAPIGWGIRRPLDD